MIEKRKYPRYVVEGLGIYAKTIFNTEVEILDISITGGSVRGLKRFSMGSEYSFKFEHGGRAVSIRGVVVWEKLSGSKKIGEGEVMPVYTAGIEFRDGLGAKGMEDIKTLFIDKVKEKRFHGVKVNIYDSENAVVGHLETCVVTDLSLGGMRIETVDEPAVDKVISLELILTDIDNTIRCKGRVAFHQELTDMTPHRYTAGVEFLEMTAGDRERLARFIEILPTDIGETPGPDA